MTLTAAFGRPFRFQVAAFRLRLQQLQPTFAWTDVWQGEHDRAFMVAGAMKADLLADLAAAVDKAISQGTSLEEFRRDFRATVAKNGWPGKAGQGTKGGEAWRTRLIYRTNMATSYAAGRWAQIIEAGYRLIVYHHGNSVEPRPQHLAWDGLILDLDNPEHARFLATHAPPNGWGCSCYLSGARNMAMAKRLGGKPDLKLEPGWDAIDPRTGAPKGIDKGWAYAPGASVADTVAALADKLPRLPAKLGADLWAIVPETAITSLAQDFSDFVDTALSTSVQRRHMIIGTLSPASIKAALAHDVPIASSEIAMTDVAVAHMFRRTRHITIDSRRSALAQPKVAPVDLDWFKSLPRHLKTPSAVVLDKTGRQPAFLIIHKLPGRKSWLVIKLNAKLHKRPGQINLVVSGRMVTDSDLNSLLGRGAILIEGEI